MKALILFILLFTLTVRGFGQAIGSQADYMNDLSNGDSLTFIGSFSDCGEWGGHLEYIYIFKKDSSIWFTYKKDSIVCARYVPTEQQEIIEVSKPLSSKQRKIVSDYIQSFLNFKQSTDDSRTKRISNGPNCFYLKTKDSTFKVCDPEHTWVVFQKTVIALLK